MGRVGVSGRAMGRSWGGNKFGHSTVGGILEYDSAAAVDFTCWYSAYRRRRVSSDTALDPSGGLAANATAA